MLRSSRSLAQRGSSSILFAIVVVPLILVFLSVGIEVSQFFGMREEALQYLDSELTASLRTMDGDGTISSKVRARLSHLQTLLTVEEVRVTRRGSMVEGLVRGRYRGSLIELTAHLMGTSLDGVPFSIVSQARRPRSGVLIVLDRTINREGDLCSDLGLRARAEWVSKVSERLRRAGISAVRVAVVPGVANEIDLLDDGDGVPRCPENYTERPGVSSVQGVPEDALTNPLAVGVKIVESAMGIVAPGLLEQGTVIIIGPNTAASDDRVAAALSFLDDESARHRLVMRAVGIVVGDLNSDEVKTVRSASGRGVYLRVSDEDLQAAPFVMALLHQVQGEVVIAK